MRRLAFAAALSVLTAGSPALGAGSNSAEYLRLGMGAPSGLSEASGSVDRGPTAMFWNPAGLAGLTRADAYFSNLGLPQGVNASFLGVSLPVASGPLAGSAGASLQVLTQEPMDRYTNTGAAAGRFSAGGQALGLTWARELEAARLGVSARLIRETVEESAGTSGAVDLGVQRDLGALSLGAALTNLGPRLSVGGLGAPLPATLRAGGAYAFAAGVTVAADLSRSEGRGVRGHLGARAKLWGPLSVGLGYMAGGAGGDGPSGLSSGITLAVKDFRADIAYRPYGELGAAIQVGVGARFGRKP